MIRVILGKELRQWFGTPFAWVLLALLQGVMGWMFLAYVDGYLELQPKLVQLVNPPGVSEFIGGRLAGSAATVLLIVIPLLTMRLIAEERRNQTLVFLLASPIAPRDILLGKFFAVLAFVAIPISLVYAMVAALGMGVNLDHGLLLVNALGLLALASSFAACGLFWSTLAPNPLVAAFASVLTLLLLWFAGAVATDPTSYWQWLSLTRHFDNFGRGLINSADLAFFAIFTVVFLALAARRLDSERSSGLALRLNNALFSLLLLVIAGLLIYLSQQHHYAWDATRNGRHTLAPASKELLQRMPGPLAITVFATPSQDQRSIIAQFLAAYQRAKPDIQVRYVDPTVDPKLVEAAGVRNDGELVVEYQQRRENLTRLNEQSLTHLLTRLARGSSRQVYFLDGHGERNFLGQTNRDFGTLGQALLQRGLKPVPLQLETQDKAPADASLLVLSQPQLDLPPLVVERLQRYVDGGGNLLWLLDAAEPRGLQPLADHLRLVLPPGVAVEQDNGKTPRNWAFTSGYGRHPTTENFGLTTVFPQARAVGVGEGSGFAATAILEVAAKGWLETGDSNKPVFDKGRDQPGPITVGVALTRRVAERDQRLVIVGNGHFLANSYIGNGANLDLGLRLTNWLVGDDTLVSVPPKPTADLQLDLSRNAGALIAVVYLFLLPALFAAIAGGLWWIRRGR